jgi:hypothetical protein
MPFLDLVPVADTAIVEKRLVSALWNLRPSEQRNYFNAKDAFTEGCRRE